MPGWVTRRQPGTRETFFRPSPSSPPNHSHSHSLRCRRLFGLLNPSINSCLFVCGFWGCHGSKLRKFRSSCFHPKLEPSMMEVERKAPERCKLLTLMTSAAFSCRLRHLAPFSWRRRMQECWNVRGVFFGVIYELRLTLQL